jgi:N-acetylmuramoyl-L-alanine amidase
MDYRQIPLGALPSPRDERNWPVAKLSPVLMDFPEEYEYPYLPPLGNQGMTNMCAAFAYSWKRRAVEMVQTGRDIPLSEACVYANRVEGQDYEGEGMYLLTAVKNGRNRGVCTKKVFPPLGTYEELKKQFQEHFTEIMVDAEPRKTTAFAQAITENEIKSSIMSPNLGPVIISIPIYPSFYQITKENPVAPIPSEKEIEEGYLGGHGVDVVGWKISIWKTAYGQEVLKCANWWGEDFGDNGYFYLPKGYPIWDGWVETDLVNSGYTPQVTVREQLFTENRSYFPLTPRGVTIHSTDTPGATTKDEFKYFESAYRAANAHYFIDWIEILRTVPENEKAWHAGKTANGQFLSIEMCEPAGTDYAKFNKVWENTCKLVADMCIRYGWTPEGNVTSHKEISETYRETDHIDPIPYFTRYGKTWEQFIQACRAEYNRQKGIKEEPEVDYGVLIFYTCDEIEAVRRFVPKLDYCPIFLRNAEDKSMPKCALAVKKLYVIGGDGTPVGHPNEEHIKGIDYWETLANVGKKVKTL